MRRKYVDDDGARKSTRHDLLGRVGAQQAYYEARRRKPPGQAAMDELSHIIHRYIGIAAEQQ